MTGADVVVVGAGLAGSAAARELALRGRDVILLEQFEPGHAHGSSHGTSRIFRFSYDDPSLVRDAMTALPLWRHLEEEVGEPLIVTTGGLDCGDVDGHAAALKECGADFELLDGATSNQRWTVPAFPDGAGILFQPDAGYARADRCLNAFVTSAMAHGARFRPRCRVRSLQEDGDRAVVETDEEAFVASLAVVTAGGWVNDLVAPLGAPLPVEVTRQTVAYFRMDPAIAFPTLVEWSEPPYYALPAPGLGVKVGVHHLGPRVHPDDPPEVDGATVERVSAWAAERYPAAEREPFKAETCIYTTSQDEGFIFERRGSFVIGSACSGHGFKFGPLTGRRLADLAAS